VMKATSLQHLAFSEVLRRVLITLGLLIVVRLGFQIPVPGLSPEFMVSDRIHGSLFGLLSTVSGGAIGQTPIFALGLLPYFTASLLLLMICEMFPSLRAMRQEASTGRRSIRWWTRVAAVPIAILQAWIIYTGVFLQHPEMIDHGASANPGRLGLVTVMSLAAGAMAVLWLGELITKLGVGSGMLLIVVSGFVARIPHALAAIAGTEDFWHTLVWLAAVWLITAIVVTCMYKASRRLMSR